MAIVYLPRLDSSTRLPFSMVIPRRVSMLQTITTQCAESSCSSLPQLRLFLRQVWILVRRHPWLLEAHMLRHRCPA
jgi:hypothetical protein